MSYPQQFILALIPSLLTGGVLAIFTIKVQRAAKTRETEEKKRRKEAKLNLDLTFATAQLSFASAMALKRGHANGEVEEAVKVYEDALKSYRKFEREQIADTLN